MSGELGLQRPGRDVYKRQDVMSVIADMRIPILSVFSRATKNDLAIMNLKLEIKDMSHMYAVIQRIQKIKDVFEVLLSL